MSIKLDMSKIPSHIAIILDGNGRWAKKRLMPRNYGHMQGSKAVELVCEEAYNIGVKYLTVYAFSTENWQRPSDEVQAIMKLLRNYLKDCIKTTSKNNMKVRILGDKAGLDDDIREQIDKLEKEVLEKYKDDKEKAAEIYSRMIAEEIVSHTTDEELEKL